MLKEILNELKLDNQPLYEMANIKPIHTGLPVTVWVSIKFENHKPRIKVMNEDCKVSILISDDPEVLVGNCKTNKILKKVFKWVKLNKNTLLDFWNDKIDTIDLANNLKSLKN